MKNYYKIFILVFSINFLFLLSSCEKEKPDIPSKSKEIIEKLGIVTLNNPDDIVNIMAYGDTRGGFFEFNRDQKNHEKVVRNILNHENIDFILFSGDSVLNGWDMERWENFYKSVKDFKENNIQFFPVLGNHELRTKPSSFKGFEEKDEKDLRRLIELNKEQEEIRQMIEQLNKLQEEKAIVGEVPEKEMQEIIDELILEKVLEKSPQDILKEKGKPSNWEVFEKYYLNAPDNQFKHLKKVVRTGKTYYAFIYNTKNSPPILVVALDTNLYTDERQYEWFKEIVDNYSEGPIVAVAHHSPYTSGIHCWWSDEDESGVGFRKKYEHLLGKVAIWIAGHDHNYERISATAHPNNQPIKKPVYIVTGAGGSMPRPGIRPDRCKEWPWPKPSDSRFKIKYNFIQITFSESILEVTSWGADIGTLIVSSESPFEEIEHFVVDWKEP